MLMLSAGAAMAHSGATGVVKERMDMMGDIAAHMKTVGQMLSGNREFDQQQIAEAARSIATHGASFERMFPAGSTMHPSEALEAIWTDWESFMKTTDSMQISATALADVALAAEDPSDIKPAFGKLGATCKSCHQDFRLKK
jgi:cytochrome c556